MSQSAPPADSIAAPLAVRPPRPRRGNAARLFGYDIFISFALGPPPRGTHSYASDLARRLRERDFTVFFSEDEAPPGEQLDGALRAALYRSKILVVIANRGTLAAPRWVRTEVEEFRKRHPNRPVIPISVGGALQDPEIARAVQEWLGFQDRIWLDESPENAERGIAGEALVERLALAPTRARSNVTWRWIVRGAVALLAGLSIGLAVSTVLAISSANRARAELRRAVSMRLAGESQAMLNGTRNEGDERAMLQLVAAHRIAPGPEIDAGMLGGLWHLRSLRKLIQAEGPIAAARFTADGSQLVAAELDHQAVGGSIGAGNHLRWWDVATGQPLGAPIPLGPSFSVVDFTADVARLATTSDDNAIHVWNARTGAPIVGPLRGDNWLVESLAFSPDGHRIVAGHQDGTLQVWNAGTGERIGPAREAHQGSVSSIAFTLDGRRFASGGDRPGVRLWDATSYEPIGGPPGTDIDVVYHMALSPDGRRFVTSGRHDEFRLWDAAAGTAIGEPLRGHGTGVSSAAFSRDGTAIASGSHDGTVRVWSAGDGQPIGDPLTGHRDGVSCVAFSGDGTAVVTGGDDATIRIWTAHPGRSLGRPVPAQAWLVSSVAFSPDGQQIAGGGSDGTLRLWNGITGQVMMERFGDHENMITSVAFTPDGKRIVSGSTDGTVRIWDAETGKAARAPLAGPGGPVRRVAISPDGSRIAASGHVFVSRQKTKFVVLLWDARTGDRIDTRWDADDGALEAFAFTAGGRHLLVGGRQGSLRVIDAESGQVVGPAFEGHSSGVTSAAFSPDGTRVASGAGDGVRIWNVRTGKLIGRALTEHKGAVSSVAFSPDGGRVVSGSNDGTLRFWDARTGQPVGGSLEGHDKEVASVAFSRDGRRIASGSADGTVRLWPAPGAWPDVLCSKLNRNMTAREWREWVSPEIEYVAQCPDLPIPGDRSKQAARAGPAARMAALRGAAAVR